MQIFLLFVMIINCILFLQLTLHQYIFVPCQIKIHIMKTTENIPAQTKPKSIMDLTPFELSQIDNYQTRNRGFRDEDEVKDWDEEMEDLNHQDWFLD